MEQKEAKIPPLHTRFGLRLLQVLLIVFCLLLIKRCVTIYHDNKETNDQIKIEFFDKGYVSGMKKAKGLPAEPETQFKNYALKKAYRDGYRQGWDMGREEIKQH
ncbi:MAG: hypothetical protein OER59_08790 [Desulfobulbaceae bacterium]|jgi:hypothetical protein|nr:hypothetical protein [Desulfobulbaceae bacterium]